jgi:hypothetical protein
LVARYTIKKLFAGKLFLGGFKRRFNPDAIPYTLGKRHQIYILDMFHSNFRIRKLLLFVETASRRRINTLFVLRKGWNFGPSIVPVSYYVPHYTGGILSNFSAVLRHYEKNAINHFVEEFPGIVCFFTNYTIQTAQALMKHVVHGHHVPIFSMLLWHPTKLIMGLLVRLNMEVLYF